MLDEAMLMSGAVEAKLVTRVGRSSLSMPQLVLEMISASA